MTELPAQYELHRLPLRALVACALRCATRVQLLIQEVDSATDEVTGFSDARVNNIALLLCQTFCREGLNAESRLADIAEEERWRKPKDALVIKDYALASGNATFVAVQTAAFGSKVMPGVATSSMAAAAREQATTAIRFALEAVYMLGADARRLLHNAVERDAEILTSLNLGIYPEIGVFVEPMGMGPLGALWPDGEPEGLLRAHAETHVVNRQPTFLSSPEPSLSELHRLVDKEETVVRSPAVPDSLPGLCRYLRSSRLIQALREKRLYCAAASSFNDPFDGQIYSHHKFGTQDLLAAIHEEIARILLSDERIPESESPHPLQTIVRHYQNGAFGEMTSDAFIDLIMPLIGSQKMTFGPSDFERAVIPALADTIRLLCFSEKHDNLLLWAHYTEDHKGGVIQLRSNNGSPYLLLSQPVQYSSNIPPSETPVDMAKMLLGGPVNSRAHMTRQYYTKSKDWAYEKEWRVLMNYHDLDNDHCVALRQEDIEAIYLGCRMDLTDMRCILDLVGDQYPSVTVYQMLKDEQEFCLNIVPIYVPLDTAAEDAGQRVPRLTQLYRDCLQMYLRFWNEPSWQKDRFIVEMVRLDAALIPRSQPAIRRAFRKVMDELQDTFARTEPHQAAGKDSPKMSDAEKTATLRPSAILLGELRDLMNEHLINLGGSLLTL